MAEFLNGQIRIKGSALLALKCVRKKRNHEYKEKQKSLKFKKTPINYSISEIVRMLEKYNRENKTRYTYGQFSELVRTGTIKV